MLKNIFLTGLLLSAVPTQGETLLTPQYDALQTVHSQDYLSEVITFTPGAAMKEGVLAYAYRVAHGNNITVAAAPNGIGIYRLVDGNYQLLTELSRNDLGLFSYEDIDFVAVSENDNWLMYEKGNTLVSVPLNTQFEPQLDASSQIGGISVEMERFFISANIVAISTGYAVRTFQLNDETGALTEIGSVQTQNYVNKISLANNILALIQSSWNADEPDLLLYQLDQNNQWQALNTHTMTPSPYGYNVSPSYVAVNPTADRVLYGNDAQYHLLHIDADTAAITELSTGALSNQYVNHVQYLSNDSVLVRADNSFLLLNSQLENVASYNQNNYVDYWRAVAINSTGITLLKNNGLTRLTTDSLTIAATLEPGEQDMVFNFASSRKPVALNNNYLLLQSDELLTLYKLDNDGLPQQVQAEQVPTLFGQASYYSMQWLVLNSNKLIAIAANNYFVLQLDTTTDQLLLLNSGNLVNRNNNPLYAQNSNITNIGNDVLIAEYDSINLYQLTADNRLVLRNSVVNGASGISGISNINRLFSANNMLFAVNTESLLISSFAIENDTLSFEDSYAVMGMPVFGNLSQHQDLVTLYSNNYLQTLKVAADGSLSVMATQYIDYQDPDNWVTIGERFIAARTWSGINVYELDRKTGLWHPANTLSSDYLSNELELTPSVLLTLGNNLGIYDAPARRLVKLNHNSAPYLTNFDALNISLNQGQQRDIDTADLFSDDEGNTISLSLENATTALSLSQSGELQFNGEAATNGSFDLIAEDSSGLASRATVLYQVNLAPIVQGNLPTINTVEGDNFTVELAAYFTDPEGLALNYSATSAVNGINLSTNGLLSGSSNTVGELTVNFIVADSKGAQSQHSVNIIVSAKPKSSSGGSIHSLLIALLAGLGLYRVLRRQH